MHTEPEEADLREASGWDLAVSGGVLLALISLAVVMVVEVNELRGAAAYERFCHFGRLADRPGQPEEGAKAVHVAAVELEMLSDFSRGDPFALRDAAKTCLRWSARGEVMILTRFRLKEASARLMGLAVMAAPSDYVAWIWLARALAANGLEAQADRCFKRCMELTPRGMELDLLHNAIRAGRQENASSDESEKDRRRE